MKKIVLLAVTAIGILGSCDKAGTSSSKEKNDFVTLTGKIKIENKENSDVYILVNPNEIDTKPLRKIFLGKDGSINDTIHNLKEGSYILLNDEKKAINLYLKQGDSIQITTDATSDEKFLDSLVVKGNIESKFYTDYEKFKAKNFSEDPQKLFSLDEKTFKAKLDTLRMNSLNFVKNYKDLPQAIANLMSMEINYGWGSVLESYPLAHMQVLKDAKYKPADTYWDFTKELTTTDVNLFKTNSKYRNYAAQEINRVMNTEVKVSEKDNPLDLIINYYKNTKIDAFIKDYMLYQLTLQAIQPVPVFELYAQQVSNNIQQQVAQYKKQNPNAPLPPLPTEADIRKEYEAYASQMKKSNDEMEKKIIAEIKDPQIKKMITTNYQVILGLNRGDIAPAIQTITANNEVQDIVEANKGKAIVVCFWNVASHQNNPKYLTEFNTIANSFKDNNNVVFMSVNLDLKNKKPQFDKIITDDKITVQSYMTPFDFDTDFVKSYSLETHPIPRFILIDKEGKIYNFDAPASTEVKFKNEVTSLVN